MNSLFCKTPFCNLKITQNNNRLSGVDFVRKLPRVEAVEDLFLQEAIYQIRQYILDPGFIFDLPREPLGTEFQQKVWSALRRIPVGEVRTYGEIARELGSSPRAVGNACRKNPLPFITPCHRVVSAQGIGGFSGQTQGYEISIKQRLLTHEGVEFPFTGPI
ncbi:Methylated-DNA--protein-cysteine methyltransferase [hydrothermal vent metagenome]|uniref:methylated-DNA--[protein]-cysteine S-methyltransferase n=1 Tax=hydrothermal vent metagenome TaxID=652676 RepID=A0A3B0XRB7_9ZZZZ